MAAASAIIHRADSGLTDSDHYNHAINIRWKKNSQRQQLQVKVECTDIPLTNVELPVLRSENHRVKAGKLDTAATAWFPSPCFRIYPGVRHTHTILVKYPRRINLSTGNFAFLQRSIRPCAIQRLIPEQVERTSTHLYHTSTEHANKIQIEIPLDYHCRAVIKVSTYTILPPLPSSIVIHCHPSLLSSTTTTSTTSGSYPNIAHLTGCRTVFPMDLRSHHYL